MRVLYHILMHQALMFNMIQWDHLFRGSNWVKQTLRLYLSQCPRHYPVEEVILYQIQHIHDSTWTDRKLVYSHCTSIEAACFWAYRMCLSRKVGVVATGLSRDQVCWHSAWSVFHYSERWGKHQWGETLPESPPLDQWPHKGEVHRMFFYSVVYKSNCSALSLGVDTLGVLLLSWDSSHDTLPGDW